MNANILYTFRRCPYAMRARWALILSRKKVIWREVLLSNKPNALLEISSKGTVPVLQTIDGEVLEESVEIMRWALLKNDPSNILCIDNDEAQEEISYILTRNDSLFKYHLDRYKYSERFVKSKKEMHRNAARQILLEWNSKLSSTNNSSNWLVTGKETLADLAVWPFVRQYRIADPVLFDQDNQLKKLRDWLKYYTEHQKFSILMRKSKEWLPGSEIKYFPS